MHFNGASWLVAVITCVDLGLGHNACIHGNLRITTDGR